MARRGLRFFGLLRLGQRRALFAWGLLDQGLSSATTFTFTVIAARNLGPAGLGTVALGYAAFLIGVGFERSLIIGPLLTRVQTDARSAPEALRAAVSTTAAGGLVLAVLALAVGLTLTGAGARGMLIFSPWIVPALIQALLRAWLYRVKRGGAATAASGLWLVTMLGAVAAGLHSSDWQITAAWGLGGCAALALAAACTPHVGVARPRAAFEWFFREAWRLGMWLSASSTLYVGASYLRAVGTSSILGPAALGGYRAIETAFAPTSLIGPAVGNPGLPTMREAVERRESGAWALAVKISLFSSGLVLAYVIILVLGRNLVFRLFGSGFRQYEYLILPIAVGQLVSSFAAGFSILLVAARRVRETSLAIVVYSCLMLALALPLAATRGLAAAAWGIAIAEFPPLVMVVIFARRALREEGISKL